MRLVKSFVAIVCLLFCFFFALPRAHAQVVLASGDPNAPPTIDVMSFSSGTFSITSAVAYEEGAGQWHKELIAPPGGGNSGDRFDIVETILNAGSQAWTDWHERVVSTTDINTTGDPNDPGFLFDNDSLHVYRNNVLLNLGTDYQIVPQPFNFGPQGNPGHWSAFDILFQPGSTIQPSDTLRIEKQIFEVFGDGDIWMPGEVAIIAQYPTIPEPTALLLAATALLSTPLGRRRRDRP
jgi:hypothetical protein